jgi:multidrug efflux system membrane fusion protein
VEAATISKGDFPVLLHGLGTVTPSATSIVKTRISGQLLDIKFKEGQLIKAGDVIAEVDPRPYQLALAQSEGQLQKDLSLLQNAERDLKRYEELSGRMKDAISGQQIDTQRALVEQYKGTTAVDKALVGQARLNLDYCEIVSLIDGRVGLRQVDQGNFVQATDSNGIAVVTRLSPITVIFTLPQNELPLVLPRFRSGANLTVVAVGGEHAAAIAKGRLIAIDNQIDPTTGTVKLRAEFANENEQLFPNEFVDAELLADTLHDVLLAPTTAIQRGAKGPFVYVIKPGGIVSPRQVKLGPAGSENVVIEDGLQSGERVVTEGADKLREGAAVTVPASNPPPPPADSAGSRKKSKAP